MPYVICKLHFTTPVRFGDDAGGSELSGQRYCPHADTLFSALYLSLLGTGKEQKLKDACENGELHFSDCLPYSGDVLYLPRPVGIFGKHSNHDDPSLRKVLKKLAYIPADQLQPFVQGTADLRKMVMSFGEAFQQTRVNLSDFDASMPYNVGAFRFNKTSGLYVIIKAEEACLPLMRDAFTALSFSGFGGKVSSGFGKFDVTEEAIEPALLQLLDDSTAPRQMLLSTALPSAAEGERIMEDACYTLTRRGGFTNGRRVSKKRTLYVMSAGSTFANRFDGCMEDVGVNMPHPVWRYEKGMFLGVRTE